MPSTGSSAPTRNAAGNSGAREDKRERLTASVTGSTSLKTGSSARSLPGPDNTLRPTTPTPHGANRARVHASEEDPLTQRGFDQGHARTLAPITQESGRWGATIVHRVRTEGVRVISCSRRGGSSTRPDNSRSFARVGLFWMAGFREVAQRSALECLQGGGRGFESLSAHKPSK